MRFGNRGISQQRFDSVSVPFYRMGTCSRVLRFAHTVGYVGVGHRAHERSPFDGKPSANTPAAAADHLDQPLTGLPKALPASQSSQDFAQGVGPLPNWSCLDVPVTSMMSPRWVNS